MKNDRFKLHLTVTIILSGFIPIIGSAFLYVFLPGRYWIDEPLHSVFEAVGSFTALTLALLILILKKNKRIPNYYTWISCALIAMGILDFFHAFSPPGDSFVWLHGMAILTGGFLFAMIWLPNRMGQSRLDSTLPTIVAVVAFIFGLFAVLSPDILPSMVNQGVFTNTAKAINVLSGLFFLLAATYFVTRYRSERSIEDFLFANFCLLNGWVGLLFPLSQLWYADWWLWHLLRLIAYFTVISYMFIAFQRSEAELEQHHHHLEELVQKRTVELEISNEKLKQEIDERIRAEEKLRKAVVRLGDEKSKTEAIIAAIGDGIIIQDTDFKILYQNRIHEDFAGSHIGEYCYRAIQGRDTICEGCPVELSFGDGQIHRAETTMETNRGTVNFELIGSPLRDSTGEIIAGIKVVRDITENKRAEEKLRKAHDELELRVQERTSELKKANKMIQQWASRLEETNRELQAEIIEREKIEGSLTESEERYRKLVESSLDAIAVHSEGKVIFANLAAAKLLRAKNPEELIGKEIMDFVHPDYREAVKERVQKMNEESKDVPLMEEKFIRLDGSVIDAEVSATPFIHQGRHGIQVIIRDVTERKRAEEALKEREHSYRTLSENLPGVVYRIFLRENNRMQFFNNMVEPMTGFTEEELTVGEVCSLDPLVLPEDWETVITTVKRAIIDKQPFRVEYRLKHKKGEVRYFTERGRPIYGQDGRPLYIDGVIFDATERKKAEERIREQASLLDNAQEAIGVRDLEHNIIYWNKGAERLYGWTAKEVIGKNPIEFLYKNKEEPAQLIEAKRIVLEKGEWIGELRQVTKDRRELIVESRWTLVQDSNGNPKSIFIINADITEKKNLEAQYLRAQRLESIGTLAGGIAHDINNVLTPVVLSIQLLRAKFTDNESRKMLDILDRSTKRGANLVKQVQLFARGVQGERVALQVSYLISEMFQIAKETFPRSIEIRTDIPKDLWTISGDATQLHQVIMNLCVNARDAMPEGGVLSISAENIFIDENYTRMNIDAKVGQYVIITVSDTGTGISPEILDRIFEPFFTTKQPGKGTGLGLSTSLGIVKSHGGFINVYSEVGKGTVFKVYLPVAKAAETQKMDEESEVFEGHGDSVLVVDDEAMVREITNSILQTNGYKVLTASEGQEAIEVYTQNREKIKVVLVDMMMPVMDGQSCIKALRGVNPGIKIIAVSGLAHKEKLANFAVENVKAFLSKPYTAKMLLKIIHEVISAK